MLVLSPIRLPRFEPKHLGRFSEIWCSAGDCVPLPTLRCPYGASVHIAEIKNRERSRQATLQFRHRPHHLPLGQLKWILGRPCGKPLVIKRALSTHRAQDNSFDYKL